MLRKCRVARDRSRFESTTNAPAEVSHIVTAKRRRWGASGRVGARIVLNAVQREMSRLKHRFRPICPGDSGRYTQRRAGRCRGSEPRRQASASRARQCKKEAGQRGPRKERRPGALRLVARPASKSILTFPLTDFYVMIRCIMRRITIIRDHWLLGGVSVTYALASCLLRRR